MNASEKVGPKSLRAYFVSRCRTCGMSYPRSANVVRNSACLYVVRRVRARGATSPGLASHLGRRPGGRALRRGDRFRRRRQAEEARPPAQESVATAAIVPEL